MSLIKSRTVKVSLFLTLITSGLYTLVDSITVESSISNIKSKNYVLNDDQKYLVGTTYALYAPVSSESDWKEFKKTAFADCEFVRTGQVVKIIDSYDLVGFKFYKIKYKDDKKHLQSGWVYGDHLKNSPRKVAKELDFEEIQERLEKQTKQNKFNSIYKGNKEGLKAAREQMLNDINADRKSVGVEPLKENETLNNLAQLRAQQLIQNFSHRDSNGTPFSTIDAPQVGLPRYFQDAENIAKISGDNSVDGANTANRGFWDDEKGIVPEADGGHRQNIRRITNTYVGIGVAYDYKNDVWLFSQNFGDDRLSSSQCLDPRGRVWDEQSWSGTKWD